MSKLHVLFRREEESWNSFLRRVRGAQGDVVVVLSAGDADFFKDEDERRLFFSELAKLRARVTLACKQPHVAAAARKQRIRVYDRAKKLRTALHGHPQAAEAMRFFSPGLWRQHWRSRLQRMGVLSMPKLRIYILIGLSVGLFAFVLFRLLPSAEVRVWPRTDIITHTMNVTLVASGAGVRLPSQVRTLPLVPVAVSLTRSLTFDQISPEFTGTDAEVSMVIRNPTREAMSLREGTRLLNQAGMIFRTLESAHLTASGMVTVRARADHTDLYGKIVGERGNVPAGLEWELPGLQGVERELIRARNPVSAKGGRTAYRTVLQQKDLDDAKARLERELRAAAETALEEKRDAMNAADSQVNYEFLFKEDVISRSMSGFVLPTQLIGKPVESFVITGGIYYAVPAYDTQRILDAFIPELLSRVDEGKELMPTSARLDPGRVIVIEYADDRSWIKITVDVAGTERSILDPFTPRGAKFGKKLRDAIAGLSKADAVRIIRNFPEVERAEISIWPFWSGTVPRIPSSISIEPQ